MQFVSTLTAKLASAVHVGLFEKQEDLRAISYNSAALAAADVDFLPRVFTRVMTDEGTELT